MRGSAQGGGRGGGGAPPDGDRNMLNTKGDDEKFNSMERDGACTREGKRYRELERGRGWEGYREGHRGTARGGGRGGGGAPAGGKSTSRAHIELNQQITRLGSAGELCELIEARSAEFNHVNVSTAFRKLLSAGRAGVHPTARSTALHKLEECAMSNMADFESQQIANTLHIVAKTRHRPTNQEFLARNG